MGYALRSSEVNEIHAVQFGMALQLMRNVGRANLSMGALHAFLWPAIRLKQIEFIYANHGGAPVAYIMWAYLTDEVVAEFVNGSERLLDLSEWNEGDNLWVMDVAATPGALRPMLYHVLSERLPHVSRVQGLRQPTKTRRKSFVDVKFRAGRYSRSFAKYIAR